jgi:signal-transduction protein with cAMP-binding, CBS, and nucleotidyltransferase domain
MELEHLACKPAITAGRFTPLSRIARLMRDSSVGSVVVVDDDDRALGIVTDRDLAVRGLAHGLDGSDAVEQVMSHPVTTIPHDAAVRSAAETMSLIGCRRLPVVDDGGRVVGVVSLDDLTIYLADETDRLTEAIASETAHPRTLPTQPELAPPRDGRADGPVER